MQNISRAGAIIAGCTLVTGVMLAQFGRGGGNWNAGGADPQRTSWVRTDNRISATTMPGFQFLWKVKANNEAKQNYALSSAVMVDSYIGYRGFRAYAFLAGASNNVVALDSDLGRVEWTKNFGSAQGTSPVCSGAMTAGVARPAPLAPAAPAAGRAGGGRAGQRAASGVSEPEAGAITIGQGRGGGFGGPGGPAGASGGRGGAVAIGANGPGGRGASGAGRGPGGFGGPRAPDAVYAVTTDGMLHTLYISNGGDAKPPVRFLPANANASGLLLVDNVIYASTSGNCGGAPNGVWAIDTAAETPTPMHWATNGGGVAGTYGAALGTDGTVYAATEDGDYTPTAFSDSLVALEAKTLKMKDWFTPGKSEFTSSPVVFMHKEGDKDKDLIAVANKDGNIYLLDSAALGGADHKTPLASAHYAASGADAGALASWEDASGTRWVLVSSANSVIALKVVDQNGKFSLQQGWAHDIASPLPPIVINGFVFTAASGSGSKPGVFYALDGVTGKELFNSGSTITGSIPRSSGIAGSAGQIYVTSADSTIYAFGIPLVSPALAAK